MTSIRDATREVATSQPNALTGREILEAWIPSDPNRRVYTAIRATFIERFAQYYQLLEQTVSNDARSEPPASPIQLHRLEKESMTLARYLFSSSHVYLVRDWTKPSIVKFLLREIKRPRRGRPTTRLFIAMQAKEMKLTDPKRWTWPKITAELCDCRKPHHTITCQDNLRREVLYLENILRKLGISV